LTNTIRNIILLLLMIIKLLFQVMNYIYGSALQENTQLKKY